VIFVSSSGQRLENGSEISSMYAESQENSAAGEDAAKEPS